MKTRIDSFLDLDYLTQLKSSENGTIGFIKSQGDIKINGLKSDLYILDSENNPARLSTSGTVKMFYWIDDDTVIFPELVKEEDKNAFAKGIPLTVFQKMSITSGVKVEFLRFDMVVNQIADIGKGKFLVKGLYNNDFEKLKNKCKTIEELAEAIEYESDFIVADELPMWQDGIGNTSKRRNRLYVYDSGKVTPLTGPFNDVEKLEIYENTATIITNEYTSKRLLFSKLSVINLDTLEIKEITHRSEYKYFEATPISDSQVVICGSDLKKCGYTQEPEFLLYDFVNDKMEILDDSEEYKLGSAAYNDSMQSGGNSRLVYGNGGVYVIVTMLDTTKIIFIDIDKKNVSLITNEVCLTLETAVVNNELYFIGALPLKGGEIHKINELGNIETVTSFNSNMDEYTLSQPENCDFINDANIEIQGWSFKPVDYVEGNKYPTILMIHGGPKLIYSPIYIHEFQYLTAQGYGIIFCNPRGSAGRGVDFGNIQGKFGTIDYDDIMLFVDKAMEKYDWIDKDNLGVTGGSYGGFMTNWVIGHTDRFKAAVSQRSVSNWLNMQVTADTGHEFVSAQMKTTMWKDHESMWNTSPIKYADKVTTPTLFIHAEDDNRCHVTEAITMFAALKEFNIDSRLVRVKRASHMYNRNGLPKLRIRRLEEIRSWFDKYLK